MFEQKNEKNAAKELVIWCAQGVLWDKIHVWKCGIVSYGCKGHVHRHFKNQTFSLCSDITNKDTVRKQEKHFSRRGHINWSRCRPIKYVVCYQKTLQ